MENDVIAVIDMKAFYASIECVERGLDPLTALLCVTDTTRKESTIVLSVSSALKKLGVPSRCRRREIPKNIKGIIYAIPQMEKYVKKSAEIVSIILDFVGQDDLHIYSIDECFINIGPYLKLYKSTPRELCRKILNKIKEKTGLIATCGIGPNMFMAKVCDDIDAKNSPDFIAEWTMKDVETKLWPLRPVTKMWGISNGYAKRLTDMGIYSIYDLAHYDKENLKDIFGILGEELWNHANGIDEAKIREKYNPINKGLSEGQVLMRDYKIDEVPIIIEEMCDEISIRLRKLNKNASTVHLMIGYSNKYDGGFSRQCQLLEPTSSNKEFLKALLYLFDKFKENKPVRRVGVSLTGLQEKKNEQMSLFENIITIDDDFEMYKAIDEVMEKYGKNSILRTSSLTKSSTIKERHNQIGGHRK